MDPRFGIGWGAILATWMLFEVLFPWIPAWAWALLIGCGVALEVYAAIRKGDPDTASEGLWIFGAPGPARDWVLRGLAGAVSLRVFSLPFILQGTIEGAWAWLAWGPLALICLGVFRWLWSHWPDQGRTG